MSGIVGIYHLDGRPVDRDLLTRMTGTIASRGPDGAGHWTEGPVGLGHVMLYTTPESLREKQPLTDETGDLCLVLDGRVDNREELKKNLEANGARLRADTDAELVLRSFECWGTECPKNIIGDFVFAIWDRRKRQIFCARDHFGVKPLYYHHRAGHLFIFASEIKAILSYQEVPQRINEGRIADYLVLQLEGIDHSSTFYEEIFRLPPAHTTCATPEGLTIYSYWSLNPAGEVRYASDSQYAEAFLEVFTESVGSRLHSASRPASMLSGGLDSSSIVGVARNLLRQNGADPLMTFSAVSEQEENCEETQSIRAVIEQGDLDAHTVHTGQLAAFLPDVDRILRNMDDLFDSELVHLIPAVFGDARNRGVRVLLTGLDGDLVVSHGHGYIAHILRDGRLRTAIAEARGMSKFYHPFKLSPWVQLYENSRAAFAHEWLRRIRRKLRNNSKRGLEQAVKNTIINIDFARRINLTERLDKLYNNSGGLLPKNLRESQARSIKHPYLVVALERYDRVASAFSIELRHPFLDKRLVEFCLALPWEQKRRNGWSKIVLRRAMAGILPEAVRWRRFGQHLGWQYGKVWFALMKDFIDDVMENNLKAISPYVNVPGLLSKYQRCSFEGISQKEWDDEQNVWRAACLFEWIHAKPAATAATTS